MTSPSFRSLRPALPLAFLFSVVACASSPDPMPAVPAVVQVAGSYSGSITIDGNFLGAGMEVAQNGAELSGQFIVSEIGITTDGEGEALADRFTFRVPYAITCPGVAFFRGTVDGAGVLSGTLEATDCNGSMSGTFRFTRR